MVCHVVVVCHVAVVGYVVVWARCHVAVQALEVAKTELKFLLIYLHSEDHQVSSPCREK